MKKPLPLFNPEHKGLKYKNLFFARYKSPLLMSGIFLCLLLINCKKKTVEAETGVQVQVPIPPPAPAVVVPTNLYTETNNTAITLTNYTFAATSNTNFIGKILPASLSGDLGFSKSDSINVQFRHDSLFLTDAGKAKLLNEKYLDINVQITSIKQYKSFKLVLNEFINNKVIAHRGAYLKLGYPENSMASLKQAIILGCQASETDTHLTADKQLVICHDDTYAGLTIEKSTYAQLAATKLSNGETLPLAKDYIAQIMTQNKTGMELELKISIISSARGIEAADSLVSLVHKMKAQAWIHYTTFGYDLAQRIEQDDPTAKAEYITAEYKEINGYVAPPKLKADGIWGMNYYWNLYVGSSMQVLKDAHSNGIYAIAWTVDDAPTMTALLKAGIDGIVTNNPELLFSLINK